MTAQAVVLRVLALGALRIGKKVMNEVFREMEQRIVDRTAPQSTPKLRVMQGGKK